MSNRDRNDGATRPKLNKELLLKTLRIFDYIKPNKYYFISGLIALIFSSITVMALPKSIGMLVDVSMGKVNDIIKDRNQVAYLLTGILVLQGFFSFMRIWLFAKVNEPALANIRKDLYNKIICKNIAFFEENRIGDLTSRITNDVSALQDTLSLTLAEFFRQISILLVGIIFLFNSSVHLTLVMLSTFPFVIFIGVVFGRFIQKNSRQTQDALADANIIAEETFQSINTVKAYTNEHYESKRYSGGIQRTLDLAMKNAIYRGVFITFIIVIMFGSIIYVFWKGTELVEMNYRNPAEGLSIGKLIEFLTLTIFIGGSVGGLSDSLGKILRAIGASGRIVDIIDSDQESDTDTYEPVKLKGKITFDNISFAYPSRTDVTIFDQLSFTIQPGQKVALVGPSGAGKSTIIQLLLRFYEPQSGRISIDNIDSNTISIKQLRNNMAIVPQEVILFGGTIRENILYGKLDATDEEVIYAAQKANAMEFIERFPDGLDTVVGERGVKLSGGQRQRIAIARAILKDPAILLLDEATSALDASSEKLVQAALDTLMEGRTSIIIAHRLSTIRNADKILVLNHGKIIEEGNHDLLSQLENGLYNQLLKLQYQLY